MSVLHLAASPPAWQNPDVSTVSHQAGRSSATEERRWFWITPAEARAFMERRKALDEEFQRPHGDEPAEGTQLYEYLLGFYPTHERAPEIPEQKIDNDQQPPTGSE
ncbi:MAG TPA: hypothetical protein VKB35_20425 [Ktedonobacteraceae bacterium]|nr:hypothetical protein [Ktedonobacteraceae bacterium]